MTLDFYDLKEEPFGFLPDSRFLYLSSAHRQAIATLLRALHAGRGFVTLLAQPDMGKTTLLFQTLNSLGDRVSTVYLFQAPRTPVDLLRAVLTDLGVHEIEETAEGMSSQLRKVLLEAHSLGKRVIVVIDEAQNLDTSILDLVCTLPNLATIGVKLIQFILCGQPLLADKLALIRPLQAKELGAAAHLEPFSAQDTAQYVDHRLRTAGYSRQSPLFTSEAAALVARYSQGTPRMINHLCFEALSTAYRYRRQQIEPDTVLEAAASLDLHPAPARAQAVVRETSRPVPQPVTRTSNDKVHLLSQPTAVLPRLSPPKTPEEEYAPGLPIAVEEALAGPVLALQTARAAALQARNSLIAVRSWVSRPLASLTIAALFLLAFSLAVFGMYRAQTVHPLAKQTMAASPLPQSPAATPAPMPNFKAMDLPTALHALATKKQRQQQNRTAEGAPPLH